MIGKYVRVGDKLGTNYAQTGDAMWEMLDDFYGGAYHFAKSAGGPAPTYGDNGYFNAIMGKQIMAAMFSSDNVWTALGSKPYNHEGVRIATKFATYGVDPATGKFRGIGWETLQDGKVAEPVKMDVGEYREPIKDITFAYDYGMTLLALENKDDVSAYNDYVDLMSRNFSDYIDKTLVQPLGAQPTADDTEDLERLNKETSLNSVARCIASYKDVKGAVTSDMVCPYGGDNGDFKYRVARGDGGKPKENLSGQLVDLNGAIPTLLDLRKLYRKCSVNWADSSSPNNKCWFMGNIMQDKIAALMLANNVMLDTVYVQKDFNGVKTIPGRDIGFLCCSFQNVPILQDGNINFDYDTCAVSEVKYGDTFLLDLNHIWMSMLTPVEMYNVNNIAITRWLREMNVMHMRTETRIDSFIQHGRLIGVADEAE